MGPKTTAVREGGFTISLDRVATQGQLWADVGPGAYAMWETAFKKKKKKKKTNTKGYAQIRDPEA